MSAISDPIADMLTRIRNGLGARHPRVDMPSSKLRVELARILKEEGYIANYKVAEEAKKKVGAREIPRVMGGMGINILTTPRGLMTGKSARKAGVGGELLCNVT